MSTLSTDQVSANWSVIASAYEEAFEGLSSQFAAEVLKLLNLKPGERVVDVAAGTGAFSLLAARAGAEVLATDFAPGMVAWLRERIAAERLSSISAEEMDGQALAVADGSFDASVSVLGLIFFPDIAKGIAELRRVLRPAGRVGIVCWNKPEELDLMTLVVRSIKKIVPEFQLPSAPPTWARLYGADLLSNQLQKAGFQQVEVTTVTGTLRIESPQTFWSNFTSSAPPLAYLFNHLGPERTAAVGREYMALLQAKSLDAVPTLRVEACIGIGTA